VSNKSIIIFFVLTALSGLMLFGNYLFARHDRVDISVALKELHMKQGVVAVICPETYYEEGQNLVCVAEGPDSSLPIEMMVVPEGITYRYPEQARETVKQLGGIVD
jgi:hypothetical protein